jgi:ribosomal protein L16 Arg81 hydroxylase
MSATQSIGKLGILGLESLLNLADRRVFLEDYWGKQFLHVPGWDGKFATLLSWASFNDILRRSPAISARLRLSKKGVLVDPQSYLRYGPGRPFPTLSPSELVGQLRDGATLVLDAIDEIHEPIMRLAQNLERTLHVHIQVNMYASWRSSPAFDLHWDDHDVIVAQIFGRKHWRVYGSTERFPVDRQSNPSSKRPEGAPVWEGFLNCDDGLYIPRGWWHVVTGCDEPAVHLTIGINNPTGLKVLQWMGDLLKLDEFIRMDVPRFAKPELQAEYVSKFRKKVSDFFDDPKLLLKFSDALNAMAEPRPAYGLPWSATPDILPESDNCLVSVVAPRGMQVQQLPGTQTVQLEFYGKQFKFNDVTAPLFNYLSERAPISLLEFYRRFCDEFNQQQLRDFVSDLVKHGIVVLTEPGLDDA